MPYGFLEGQPFLVVYLSLFAIVVLRAQATYWLGRGVWAGLHRTGMAERLGTKLTRAHDLIDRYGPPAVTLSFFTIGIQTAVNFTAGAMRMSFPRYLVAMLLGCMAWAGIYSLGGMAVIAVWWNLFIHSPLLAVGATAALAAVVVGVVRHRRRRRAAAEQAAADPSDPADPTERVS
ncbi:membrane protein DedA with SNARE-associated domain [Nocardiopsis mwathae]|uniref:Membrane protein DedA with SNARE-associated domain n=1 Tax=Nocardiopsis mwathae TaxID=1472723 RepID=A0A7X0D3V2_9ACTN|nr:VTT domain-containing protein [Nocardiopsis mwathae]MBB6170405.1 membrane protein DedA with SNARE-associated domain [Nocardiopsis mwathae]